MFSNNYHYILLIGITTSMSLALYTCVLLILLNQSENGAQFLVINNLLVLFANAPAAVVFGMVTVPLTTLYTLL